MESWNYFLIVSIVGTVLSLMINCCFSGSSEPESKEEKVKTDNLVNQEHLENK